MKKLLSIFLAAAMVAAAAISAGAEETADETVKGIKVDKGDSVQVITPVEKPNVQGVKSSEANDVAAEAVENGDEDEATPAMSTALKKSGNGAMISPASTRSVAKTEQVEAEAGDKDDEQPSDGIILTSVSDAKIKTTQSKNDPLAKERQRINSASANPGDAQNEYVDELVDNMLAKITTPDMDNFQKLKACYDYLTKNMVYSWSYGYMNRPFGDGTFRDVYNSYGEVESTGAIALSLNRGQCDGYNTAFLLLAEAIGFDGRLVDGVTRRSGGGYTYHKWAEISLNGTTYVFDPQVEQTLNRIGLPNYSVFCKTYAEVPGRYRKR